MFEVKRLSSCVKIISLMIVSLKFISSAHAENELEAIEPMIGTSWGQSGGYNPNFTYNNKTPWVGNNLDSRAPVGCIAVAFGQVLNFYDFPKKGIGSNSYCNSGGSVYRCDDKVEADFFLTQYNWNAMPSSLNSVSSTESIDAVSTLLYHIGASVNVKYGEQGSAAKLANPAIIKNFRKHFNMSAIETEYRRDHTMESWSALVINEIKQGRPVVFVGFNTAVDAGHAYVLDGLNSLGQVHVNWGWGGYLNGYFDLDSLKTPHGSFTEDLFALVNFTPNIKTEGMSCNGPSGDRCIDELSCVANNDNTLITDFVNDDRYGTCLVEPISIVPIEVKEQIKEESGFVEKNEWLHLGSFDTLENISVTMTGDGDADLYVRKDSQPGTAQGQFDCRPYSSGSSERCRLDGKGEYFVSVRGYNASNFNVTIVTQVDIDG